MKREHLAWALVACLLFTGCTAVGRAFESVDRLATAAAGTVEQGQGAIADLRRDYETLKDQVAEIDADGDGKVTFAELMAYLGSGGGLVLARNALSSRRKEASERETAELRGEVRGLAHRIPGAPASGVAAGGLSNG